MIARAKQILVAELTRISGAESGNIYLRLFEQPLYMENQFHTVTGELITRDTEADRLMGQYAGKMTHAKVSSQTLGMIPSQRSGRLTH